MKKKPIPYALAHPMVLGGKLLGWGKTQTFAIAASGELRTFLVGRRRYVSQQALLDYIAAREAATNPSEQKDEIEGDKKREENWQQQREKPSSR